MKMSDGVKEKASIFTTLQWVTTGGATLCFLRAFNTFITHKQRGQTLSASIGLVYLSVANEMGFFPFNFFVKERVSLREKTEQPTPQ